jgi:tripartite-type tricarboxylate transporter receptor subunit TctC
MELHMKFMIQLLHGLLTMTALLAAHPTVAQAPYPTRPVSYIIPLPPGGAMDVLARGVARGLTDAMGQQVLVENRPGANMHIAAGACARAKPDAHTFCMINNDNMVILPHLEKINYDTQKDFMPVTQLVYFDAVMTVHPAVPANTLRELTDYSRRNPGKINYTGLGVSSRAFAESINQRQGSDMFFVPYKGAAEAFQAFLAGDVQVIYVAIGYPGLIANINSGKWKALAVAGEKRNPLLPSVPTYIESGLPDFTRGRNWQGIFVPTGTPPDAVARLSAALSAVVREPAFRDKQLTPLGFEAIGNTPEEFAKALVQARLDGEEIARIARPFVSQ